MTRIPAMRHMRGLAFLFVMFASTSAAVAGDPVGHWPMDDNAGNAVVNDNTTNNYHGTFSDSTNPNTSYHHSADRQVGAGSLIFDGTDDYVTFPWASVLEIGHSTTRQLSVSAWIKHDSIGPPGGYATIVGTGDGGWYVGSLPGNNELIFACWLLSGASGQTAVVTDGTPVFDGQWHHVVGVFDGLSVHLYVDGNHGEQSTIGGTIRNISNKPVLIGENAGATGRHWDGRIDDVRIYDYALTSGELLHLYNPDLAWAPGPANGAAGVAVDTDLSWSAGDNAVSHDIYLGTDQIAVGDANNTSAEFKGNDAGTTFDPGLLEYSTSYYWRIDEINPAHPNSPWKGDVWSFTTRSEFGGDIVFPGATWTFRTPAELGLDGARLDQFAANVGGVGCIVRQGYMVKTWGDQSSKGQWASASKPVTSTMLFYAIEEGLLTSVHDKIGDHGWNLVTKDEPMEFYHLANMTGGYARGEAPGARWAYNDYGIRLYMETLFGRVFSTTADAAARHPNRLGALQFQDGTLFEPYLSYGEQLNTTARDFARIGLFWCNKGYWAGSQLLPEHYFNDYMRTHVPGSLPRTSSGGSDYLGIGTCGGGSDQTAYGPGIYGFNWWFNPNKSNWPDAPEDTFQANGHWGQEVMTVIPSLSLVVACRGNNGSFEPGNPNSSMNQNLELLVQGCPPFNPSPPSGQIIVDPDHPAWLRYRDGGSFYMCGPGDPEDFLYRGTRNADGTRTGDQMSLINKLAGTGANSIYFQAVRSHGGDGDAYSNPFVNGDINGSLDEDIVNQWETWFTALDNNGITIFFIFYDDNAQPFGHDVVNGELIAQETYFIDEIVSRYKHHKHLIWCVAEEYQKALSSVHVSKIAERIKRQDDNDHVVAVHQLPGTSFSFNGNTNLDQFAMQLNNDDTSYVHDACVSAWSNVGGLKNVNLAEIYTFSATPITGSALRQKAWAAAMGGAYSMWLWMDIASTPVSDLQTCGRVVQFMESTRFSETAPYDSLARGNTDYVLANPGQVYIVYGDSGTSLGVNVVAGTYRVKWFDPVDGDWVDQGVQTLAAGDRTFTKPGNISSEAVVYLATPTLIPPVAVIATTPSPAEGPAPLAVSFDASGSHDLDGTIVSYQWDFTADGTYDQTSAFPATSHQYLNRGVYTCRLQVVDNDGLTDEATVTITVTNVSGDFDGDGDVDQKDFGHLQACYSGSGQPQTSPDCLDAILDGDEDVDLGDFAIFQSCLSGSGKPASPSCAN